MTIALVVILGVVVIGAGSVVAPRIRVPLPLLLVVVGVLLALIPAFPRVELDPDIVLGGLLPPLLYAAAFQTSFVDLKRTIVGVVALAVGAVVLTTLGVGLALSLAVPAIGFAAAAALGAAVAPPDAVATTALARSVGMPRRYTQLLEDESLLNDPAALVAQSVALTALTATVTPLRVGGDLLLAVAGGAIFGIAVGLLTSLVRQRITDPVLSTLVSFATPYLAFLPAEGVGGSGVLAVVVAGLITAQQSLRIPTAGVRLTEGVNWRTISFALENAVFLLIGLQLPTLIRGVREFGLATVVTVCAVVFGTVIITRFVFVIASWGVARLLPFGRDVQFRGTLLLGWAGMRGVVTLAAAFLLPTGSDGYRAVLQLAAFVVVGGTLLLQGLTLGPLIRLLRFHAPDPAEDALQAAALMDRAVGAADRRLDALLTGDEPDHIVEALRARNAAQARSAWEVLGGPGKEAPTAVYRRLRSAMLSAQRDVVLGARHSAGTDDVVLREALSRIDQEEATLDSFDDLDSDRDGDLLTPDRVAAACEHLRDAPLAVQPNTPGECEDCVREGATWVHLRTCLTCGHVGCCDSSELQHASAHFHATRHPVMCSAEYGEAWRWCYVDEVLG